MHAYHPSRLSQWVKRILSHSSEGSAGLGRDERGRPSSMQTRGKGLAQEASSVLSTFMAE